MSRQPECLIIGGGVAGLWLLSSLRDAGADAWLLEKNTLGSGQTLASQGIIHGGAKYSLTGTISGSTKAIAAMPGRWNQHIEGRQLPRLRRLETLADSQLLLTRGGLKGKLFTMLASKALVSGTNEADIRDLHLTAKMVGMMIQERIIDTLSLVTELQSQTSHFCRQYQVTSDNIVKKRGVWSLQLRDKLITPTMMIFAAGESNEQFIKANKMQLRPLHMVYLRHPKLFPIYAHIVDPSSRTPLCTISSHYDNKKRLVWYIGGELAEAGVNFTSGQQCIRVEQLLRKLWSNTEWGHASWKSFIINRAEHHTMGFMRPEHPGIVNCGKNAMAVFPTKLTFAPMLADMVTDKYRQLKIELQDFEPGSPFEDLPLAQLGSHVWNKD